MPTFELTDKNGATYDVDAPDELAALSAFNEFSGGVEPERSAFDDIDPSPDFRAELDNSLSNLDKLIIGIGRGFVDVGEGVGQIALEAGDAVGLVDPETVESFNQGAQSERDVFNAGDLGVAGASGRIIGNVAATVIPGAPVARVAGLPALAAKGRAGLLAATAAGGGAAGATQFVEDDGSRAVNASIGAGASVVLAPLIGALSNKLGKLAKRGGRAFMRNRRLTLAKSELAGTLPDGELDRVANDIADGLTPEQAMRKYEIEQVGATPTRGRVTGDLDDLRFEVEQGRQAGRLSDIDQGNRAGIDQSLDARVAEFGADTDAFSSGTATAKALTGSREAAKKVESEAFDAAQETLENLGDDLPVQLDKIRSVVAEEIDNLALPESAALAKTLQRNNVISSGGELIEGATLTPKQASVLRKSIQRATAPREAGVIQGKLKRALDDDVVDSLGEDVFAGARKISAKRFADFDNREKVAAIIDGKIPPERITGQLTKNSFSVKQINELFETLDKAGGGAANNLRASVLDDLFGTLRGATDQQGVPGFNTRAFSKRLSAMGDAKVDAIFGKGAAGELRKQTEVIRRVAQTDFRIKNPGTAAEAESRVRRALASLIDIFPGGRYLVGLGRAASEGAKTRETGRLIDRALNLELLARDNVLNDIVGRSGASLAAGAAAGGATN